MENLFYNISQVLGVTIIHSLWQGLLVWFVLHLLLTCAPGLSSGKKHNLGMTALLVISAWFMYTFIVQLQQHVWVTMEAVVSPGLLPHFDFPLNTASQTIATATFSYIIEGYLPYISALYLVGLLFNLLRMGLNWQKISLIKNTMIPADSVQIYVDGLCKKLHIRKYISVNFTRMVDVPCMIGFFKPIILLPISLTTYLSTTEIETILLHELSHIKRNDYLFNLLQQAVTILLFFNPFAQLINRIINQERENRCDDLVVQTTAQPLVYAQALLKLEQSRQSGPQLAMAATGKKHHLLNRIERIMKTTKPIGNVRHLLVAVAIMAASISSIAWLNPTIANGKITIKKIVLPAAIVKQPLDTLGRKANKPQHSNSIAAKKAAKVKAEKQQLADSQHNGYDDDKLQRLSAEVAKKAEVVGKYYNSPEFASLNQELAKSAQDIALYYNSPDIKDLQEKQQKLAAELQQKIGDNSDRAKLSEQMGQLGGKIGKYYGSPEFKKLNAELEKKYGIKHQDYYDSRNHILKDENYMKYQAELQSKIPAEVKAQGDQMKKLGEEMRAAYSSPEIQKLRAEMKAVGDSLRQHTHNDQTAAQRAQMDKLREQMRQYRNNPELKEAQAQLKQASKELKDYTNSPAFKKRMEEYNKQVDEVIKDKTNYQDMQPSPVQ